MPTIYDLKPAFQRLLHPLCNHLARKGISPNQLTLGAAVLSIAQGLWLTLAPGARLALLVLPLVLFLRMALNAIDGMLASEQNLKTPLGLVLNELGDVIADTALYLPFALIPGVNPALVVLGGDLTRLDEMLMTPLRARVHSRTMKGTVAAARIQIRVK